MRYSETAQLTDDVTLLIAWDIPSIQSLDVECGGLEQQTRTRLERLPRVAVHGESSVLRDDTSRVVHGVNDFHFWPRRLAKKSGFTVLAR